MSNSFFLPIDRTLSGATTQGQNRPGSDSNEDVLQSSSIFSASLSDCLVSYSRYSLGVSYASAETQSMYFIALADCPIPFRDRVDMGVMAMKEHSAFLKDQALLGP